MGQQAGPLSDNGEILLASEIARWLRIGISTVYQWAHAGTIPCMRLNGSFASTVKMYKHGSRLNKCLHHRGLNV